MRKVHLILLAFSLLISNCTGRPRDPTVTFSAGGCTYDGPEQVKETFTIQWTVDESVAGTVILMVLSAEAPISLAEMAGMPASDPPPAGITKLAWAVAMGPGSYSKEVDLGSNAAYQGEPVYLVCFSPDEETALGAGGPLEVKR